MALLKKTFARSPQEIGGRERENIECIIVHNKRPVNVDMGTYSNFVMLCHLCIDPETTGDMGLALSSCTGLWEG